jgi:dolichol-phosphate mannosyltransferase
MNDFSDLTVIIPTLNEAESVPELAGLLLKKYGGVKIIISDDGSSDGTKQAVSKLQRSKKNITFLDRKNKSVHGLTESVIDAAQIVKTKKIIVMDGDMQHPYQKVGDISKMLDKSDIVIGVRTHVKNWGAHRRIASKTMSSFVYAVFKLRGLATSGDMMSGFFGIKTNLFKSLIAKNKKAFVGKGYKVLLDTLRIIGKDVTISEIRFGTFQSRRHGKSKLGINQLPNTLKSTLG